MNDNIYIDVVEYHKNFTLNDEESFNLLNEYSREELKQHYEKTYNTNMLKVILEFYGLNKRGKKSDLINNIVDFEINDDNNEIVVNRMRLWFYLNELKSNSIFSKYINII